MRRLALLGALSLAGGCLDFEGLRDSCRQGRAPCDDAGNASGGGGGGGAGGGSAGGGSTPGDGGEAPVCFNGYCWENPLPQGNDLAAVAGSTPNDVWAGGAGNALLHWDGASWTSFQVPPQNDPQARVTALLAVGNDVYAAFARSALRRWNGSQWVVDGASAPLQALSLSGTRADDVWAGTESGEVQRRGATGWSTAVAAWGGGTLGSIASDGHGGVWYEHQAASVIFPFSHYPPEEDVVTFGFGVSGVWPLSDGTMQVTLGSSYSILVSRDGGLEDAGFTGFEPHGTHVHPDGIGLAVGTGLSIAMTTGRDWTSVSSDAPSEYNAIQLEGVWTAPALTGSWAVGPGGVMLRHDGSRFVLHRPALIDGIEAIAENGGMIVAVGASDDILRRDEASGRWVKVLPFSDSTDKLAVCALPDGGFAFGGGSGKVYFWRDTTGALPQSVHVPDDSSVTGLLCLPSGTVFAGTFAGGLFRYDGQDFQTERDGGPSIFDLDGWDEDHVWAAGYTAYYARRSDGGWQTRPAGADFSGVRADRDAGRVWFAGGRNLAEFVLVLDLHDGGTFEAPFASTTDDGFLFTIKGAGPDLWTGGRRGALYRWSGSRWEPSETGSRQGIAGLLVHGGPDGGRDLWLVGDRGSVLHHAY